MKKEYCEIFNECFPQFKMRPETFSTLFNADKAVCFEHEENGSVIAFAIVEDFAIRLMCVTPERQRSGVGSALLKQIEDHLIENGYEKVITGGTSSKMFIGAVSDSVGFFEKRGFTSVGSCEEMLMELSSFSPDDYNLHGHDIAEYGWFDGDMEEILQAVSKVNENWCPFFTKDSSIYVGRVDGEIACFCIVDLDRSNYLSDHYGRVGTPGCVGTVPKFRNKGIALEMIALVTQYLKDSGMDISFIFFTGVAKWYEKLGYKTFLTEIFCEKQLIAPL